MREETDGFAIRWQRRCPASCRAHSRAPLGRSRAIFENVKAAVEISAVDKTIRAHQDVASLDDFASVQPMID
jgi:hypothetical protein